MQENTPNPLKAALSLLPEKFCKYIHRYCNQSRIDGYDYCIRHILEDRQAPFRQCSYTNPSNKRKCPNATPMGERRDSLCPFHAKRASSARIRITLPSRRKPPVENTPAALLKKLERYCKSPMHDSRSAGHRQDSSKEPVVDERPLTLKEIEAAYLKIEPLDSRARPDNVDDDCWVETRDPLENAGIYTEVEVVRILRDKMLKLQRLYCEQHKILCRKQAQNNREFLAALRDLKQGVVPEYLKVAPPQVDLKVLKALFEHRRYKGLHKLLRHRAREKRLGTSKPATASRCVYETDGSRCSDPALVLTKFCKEHILHDPKQQLYKACGLGRNCQKPALPFLENPSCLDHFNLNFHPPPGTPNNPGPSTSSSELLPDAELFQSMDDIASLGLDAITPGSLFGLDMFGDPGESTDTVPSGDEIDLMQIDPVTPNLPVDILSNAGKSDWD